MNQRESFEAWANREIPTYGSHNRERVYAELAWKAALAQKADCGEYGHDQGCCGNKGCLPSQKEAQPVAHVGDSHFEEWYQSYHRQGISKQVARDAYAAGMGDGQKEAQPDKIGQWADSLGLYLPEAGPVGHVYTINGVQHCTIEKELPDCALYARPVKEAQQEPVFVVNTSDDVNKSWMDTIPAGTKLYTQPNTAVLRQALDVMVGGEATGSEAEYVEWFKKRDAAIAAIREVLK